MLLAEIHGKRCREIVGNEDLLTSTVFGHLRLISPGLFWRDLFDLALTSDGQNGGLSAALEASGITFTDDTSLAVSFWPSFADFSQPDLIFRLRSISGRTAIVVCEVKLDSKKSGLGSDDQLAKYLGMLEESQWSQVEYKAVVYLTKLFDLTEIQDSVGHAQGVPNAAERLYSLQWQDVLEAAERAIPFATATPTQHMLLSEVVSFLKGRELQRFREFKKTEISVGLTGRFYSKERFTHAFLPDDLCGAFYGR